MTVDRAKPRAIKSLIHVDTSAVVIDVQRYTTDSGAVRFRAHGSRAPPGPARVPVTGPDTAFRSMPSAAVSVRVASGTMRLRLEQEALTLTDIGNEMQIRHFETGKAALTDAEVDYLFIRMSTFIFHVLRETERIAS